MTKAELQDALDSATARIAELEELLEAGTAPTGPVYVRWTNVGPVPGGYASAGLVSQDPPAEALRMVGHVYIDAAEYEATPAKLHL